MRSETRHQLKKDAFAEKFAETAGTTVHWAAEHRSKLILGVGAFAIVFLLILGGWLYQRKQEQKASLALAQAMGVYQAPVMPAGAPQQAGLTTYPSAAERAKAANAEFRNVAEKYSTNSGKIARYMAAVTALEMGSVADAEKDFKTAADKGDSDLASLAKFGLASVYRQTNRNKEALDVYKDLADHPTSSVSKPMAQLEMGAVYAAQNETERARDIYQELIKTNTDQKQAASSVVELANERMAALGK